ncbi:hypothetical protein [Priestia megaterium]
MKRTAICVNGSRGGVVDEEGVLDGIE